MLVLNYTVIFLWELASQKNISVHQLTGIAAKHFRVFAVHLRFSIIWMTSLFWSCGESAMIYVCWFMYAFERVMLVLLHSWGAILYLVGYQELGGLLCSTYPITRKGGWSLVTHDADRVGLCWPIGDQDRFPHLVCCIPVWYLSSSSESTCVLEPHQFSVCVCVCYNLPTFTCDCVFVCTNIHVCVHVCVFLFPNQPNSKHTPSREAAIFSWVKFIP